MDKIFVNNYVKDIEIGAFQSERGCKQQVEFNICLEIKPLTQRLSDNVDDVISYEIITDAINFELKSQRFNLLETLAEKIAERCLNESRVISAEVKVEKLDRIPGSLGVSIIRFKNRRKISEGKANLRQIDTKLSLINLNSGNLSSELTNAWVLSLIKSNRPIVLIVESQPILFSESLDPVVLTQVGLLVMDQNAWLVSNVDKRVLVAGTKAELYNGLKSNCVVAFCPAQFARQSFPDAPSLTRDSNKFMLWLTKQLGIKNLYFIGSTERRTLMKEEGIDVTYLDIDGWKSFR